MQEEIIDIIRKEADAVLNIPITDDFEKAIDLIHSAVHVNKGKVVASGMGKAGQIGVTLTTSLSATGTPSIYLHPSEAQHGDLGILQENDILVLISNSGKTREIVELYHLAKRLYNHIPIILISGNPKGELAELADVSIFTGNPKEVCILGMSPTTSSTAMAVICDIISVQMMKRIKLTPECYAKRHHGGYIGEKSRKKTEETEK